MAELTRSRTPSSGKVENDPSEKEFLVRIQRKNDSSLEEKANLKLKTRPLRSGNGLQIFLTRQDDPAFYYSVDITNTDYGELQREQGLRVDLASFPRMIFELLDGCIAEEQKETPNKFPVLLYSDCDLDVTFKIQETTQYNILAHLKLQLRKGNDAKVREHLGECLKSLRHEHLATLKKLADTEQNLVDAINEKSSIKTNLDRQTEEFQKRDVTYRNQLEHGINNETQKAIKAVADAHLKFNEDKKKMEEEFAAKNADFRK